MDFEIIKQTLPLYWEAAKVTLALGVVGICLSLLLGFFFGLVSYFKIPVLQKIVGAYISLARNTPLLIQLYFLYYGFPKIGLPIGKIVQRF